MKGVLPDAVMLVIKVMKKSCKLSLRHRKIRRLSIPAELTINYIIILIRRFANF